MFEFFSITVLFLLGAMSPGPDFIMVSKNALQYSKKVGIYTTLGIALGTLVHASYCILGLAAIITQSLLAFTLIKYAGGAYLIYLGLKDLFTKKSIIELDLKKSEGILSAFSAFRQGLFCTLLNPKAIFLFFALYTMVIRASMPLYEQFSYAIENALIDLLWFSFIATMFSNYRVKNLLKRFQQSITKTCGGILVCFGLKIASLHHL